MSDFSTLPVATGAEKKRTLDFIRQEQRQGQPLSEYLDQQEYGGVLTPRQAYARSVLDSLSQPVISTRFVAEVTGDQTVMERYPNGYVTPRQFMAERSKAFDPDAAYNQFIARIEESGLEVTEPLLQMAEAQRAIAERRLDNVAGVLAGTLQTDDPATKQMVAELNGAVAEHTPGGNYAQFGGRTKSQGDQMRSDYGSDARFMLTQGGQQNYAAQRVADLWSATDPNYGPATTMAQVQRAIGGFTAPIYNMMTGNSTRLAGEEWDEMSRMSEPDGRFGYAAEMYDRAGKDTQSIYTPEGRPKYVGADMTAPQGLGNATMMNTDYPLAAWYQAVGQGLQELPTYIGNDLAGGDTSLARNLRELRNAFNRTTPEMPDGADAQEFDAIGRQLKQADTKMAGYNSAQLGPKFADAFNATPLPLIYGKADRSYLSPFMDTMVSLPAEVVGDPINLAMNLGGAATGGVTAAIGTGIRSGVRAAATSGGRNMIGRLAAMPRRVADDIVEENIEGAQFTSALGGLTDYITPENTNLLMDGKDPNDADYDQALQRNAVQAKVDQMDAAARWKRMKQPRP